MKTFGQGMEAHIPLSISNRGDYQLPWKADWNSYHPEDNWLGKKSYPLSEILNNEWLYGIVYSEDLFYISGRTENLPQIYVLDNNWDLIRTFPQPGAVRSIDAMRDLAWDGELIWGGVGDSIYGYDINGRIVRRWLFPLNGITGIAWDSDCDWLWIARVTGNLIVAVNWSGEQMATIPRNDWYVSSMDYWPEDPDGFNLYLIYFTEVENRIFHLARINPETEDTMSVAVLGTEIYYFNGIFITDEWHGTPWVMMTMSQSQSIAEDSLDIWTLGPRSPWLSIEPSEGLLQIDDSQDLNLTLSASGLDSGEFRGELLFQTPSIHDTTSIPVTMRVTETSTPEDTPPHPAGFGLGAYPNPFNTSVELSYQLPVASRVRLGVYDLNGRLVWTVQDDGFPHPSGSYWVQVDASRLPSGIYLARMEAGGRVAVRKVVCVK